MYYLHISVGACFATDRRPVLKTSVLLARALQGGPNIWCLVDDYNGTWGVDLRYFQVSNAKQVEVSWVVSNTSTCVHTFQMEYRAKRLL